MASSFADDGLVNLWRAALDAGGVTSTPTTANLIVEPFTPDPELLFADLTWGSPTFAQGLTAWNFHLDTDVHRVTAALALSWDFTSGDAGTVIYGIGIYDFESEELFFTETFPVPFAVPVGGGPLIWTFNLIFGDCANAAGGEG